MLRKPRLATDPSPPVVVHGVIQPAPSSVSENSLNDETAENSGIIAEEDTGLEPNRMTPQGVAGIFEKPRNCRFCSEFSLQIAVSRSRLDFKLNLILVHFLHTFHVDMSLFTLRAIRVLLSLLYTEGLTATEVETPRAIRWFSRLSLHAYEGQNQQPVTHCLFLASSCLVDCDSQPLRASTTAPYS